MNCENDFGRGAVGLFDFFHERHAIDVEGFQSVILQPARNLFITCALFQTVQKLEASQWLAVGQSVSTWQIHVHRLLARRHEKCASDVKLM